MSDRLRLATTLMLALASIGCPRAQDPAPLDSATGTETGTATETETETETETGAETLDLDCAGLSLVGAIDASFEYDFHAAVVGGSGELSWSVSGLPAALSLNSATGVVSGVPSGPSGEFALELEVSDSEGQVDSETCTLTIHERLSALGLVDEAMACIPHTTTRAELPSYLSGGDGSEISCFALVDEGAPLFLGDGNGRPPPGISFDAASCSHAGALTSDTRGTWVWMVEIEQSGYTTHVPFCATNDVPTFHDIVLTVDGDPGSALTPAVYAYDPDAPLSFGAGYLWSIEDPACADDPSLCNAYGFRFDVSACPFDPPYFLNAQPGDLGILHGLEAMGPTPLEASRHRPWVASFEFRYCTAAGGGSCDPEGPDFDLNAQTDYHFDVIAYPSP